MGPAAVTSNNTYRFLAGFLKLVMVPREHKMPDSAGTTSGGVNSTLFFFAAVMWPISWDAMIAKNPSVPGATAWSTLGRLMDASSANRRPSGKPFTYKVDRMDAVPNTMAATYWVVVEKRVVRAANSLGTTAT